MDMKASGHSTVGLIAGGATAAAPYLSEAVPLSPDALPGLAAISLGCLIGCATASLPDLLEPSARLGPNHRGFFHSWTVLLGLALLGFFIFRHVIAVDPADAWSTALPAIAGYLSHLLADLPGSKKRLPLLF